MTTDPLTFNPHYWGEGDPLGRWRERHPGTTLEQLRTLDPELFRDVLSWLAEATALAGDGTDDDDE